MMVAFFVFLYVVASWWEGKYYLNKLHFYTVSYFYDCLLQLHPEAYHVSHRQEEMWTRLVLSEWQIKVLKILEKMEREF